MKRRDEMKHRDLLMQSLKKITILKYALFFLFFIVLLIALSYDSATGEFTLPSLARDFFVANLTALVLTLLQDLFTRREQKLAADIDQQVLAERLSAEILGRYGPGALPDDQLDAHINAMFSDDRCLEAMAGEIANGVESRQSVFSETLLALTRRPLMQDVTISSRLRPKGNGQYEWIANKKFSFTRPKDRLRVLVTGENIISSQVNTIRLDCDFTVLTSRADGTIEEQIEAARIKLSLRSIDNGIPMQNQIHKSVISSAFESVGINWPAEWAGRVAIIDFDISAHPQGAQFELTFRAVNSLEDMYFYEVVPSPCFVSKIEIDYSALSSVIGKLAVTPLLPSRQTELEHDRDIGLITLDGNNHLFWQGQGVFIVWREIRNLS